MSFSTMTLAGFLITGVIYGYLVHKILFTMYSGQLLHCLVAGILFGLTNWIMVNGVLRQYNILKKDNKLLSIKARYDKLTGLLNRDTFEEDIASLQYCKDGQVSIIFIDLDNFREFNNQFGHQVADKVLSEISGKIKKQIREGDKVYRYGGEEIVVILENCNKSNAAKIAEKIRNNVCQMDGARYPNPTISLGVACYPADGNTIVDVIKSSDLAMLEAKRKGKNCVVLAALPNSIKVDIN